MVSFETWKRRGRFDGWKMEKKDHKRPERSLRKEFFLIGFIYLTKRAKEKRENIEKDKTEKN